MSVSITRDPIDTAGLLARTPTSSDGAALLFCGIVRDHADGRPVEDLEYEAYFEMAAAEIERIVKEALERWPVGALSVVHRVGRLSIGEASVAIAVTSPHREEAYAASRYVIDELKRRAPIWKREGYADGERTWVPGHDPTISSPAGAERDA